MKRNIKFVYDKAVALSLAAGGLPWNYKQLSEYTRFEEALAEFMWMLDSIEDENE